MPGLVMIGPVVWAVGELYTQTLTHAHERYYFMYIDVYEEGISSCFSIALERYLA